MEAILLLTVVKSEALATTATADISAATPRSTIAVYFIDPPRAESVVTKLQPEPSDS
jgi:hypothetical protein